MSRIVTIEVACREHGVSLRIAEQWIERDWLRPDRAMDGIWRFREIDVARLRLLSELHALQLGENGMPLVVSLLDQLYDARRTLARLRGALDGTSEPLRRALAERLDDVDAAD